MGARLIVTSYLSAFDKLGFRYFGIFQYSLAHLKAALAITSIGDGAGRILPHVIHSPLRNVFLSMKPVRSFCSCIRKRGKRATGGRPTFPVKSSSSARSSSSGNSSPLSCLLCRSSMTACTPTLCRCNQPTNCTLSFGHELTRWLSTPMPP